MFVVGQNWGHENVLVPPTIHPNQNIEFCAYQAGEFPTRICDASPLLPDPGTSSHVYNPAGCFPCRTVSSGVHCAPMRSLTLLVVDTPDTVANPKPVPGVQHLTYLQALNTVPVVPDITATVHMHGLTRGWSEAWALYKGQWRAREYSC